MGLVLPEALLEGERVLLRLPPTPPLLTEGEVEREGEAVVLGLGVPVGVAWRPRLGEVEMLPLEEAETRGLALALVVRLGDALMEEVRLPEGEALTLEEAVGAEEGLAVGSTEVETVGEGVGDRDMLALREPEEEVEGERLTLPEALVLGVGVEEGVGSLGVSEGERETLGQALALLEREGEGEALAVGHIENVAEADTLVRELVECELVALGLREALPLLLPEEVVETERVARGEREEEGQREAVGEEVWERDTRALLLGLEEAEGVLELVVLALTVRVPLALLGLVRGDGVGLRVALGVVEKDGEAEGLAERLGGRIDAVPDLMLRAVGEKVTVTVEVLEPCPAPPAPLPGDMEPEGELESVRVRVEEAEVDLLMLGVREVMEEREAEAETLRVRLGVALLEVQLDTRGEEEVEREVERV